MKAKQLQWMLAELETFDNAKQLLEQYATPAELAGPVAPSSSSRTSFSLHSARGRGSRCDRRMFSRRSRLWRRDSHARSARSRLRVCAGLAGKASIFSYCLGVDIDGDALQVCQRNVDLCQLNNVDLLQVDVRGLALRAQFDTVIMNPPFGTKNNWGQCLPILRAHPDSGIDMHFLRRGLSILRPGGQLFSLHKTTTRRHILGQAKRLDANASVLAELVWPLPPTYRNHKRENVDIAVDLIKFTRI